MSCGGDKVAGVAASQCTSAVDASVKQKNETSRS
ncbi:hypothetical protein L915_11731, partial [Phytophthora nicotianae]